VQAENADLRQQLTQKTKELNATLAEVLSMLDKGAWRGVA
jgi:hypothetical protein